MPKIERCLFLEENMPLRWKLQLIKQWRNYNGLMSQKAWKVIITVWITMIDLGPCYYCSHYYHLNESIKCILDIYHCFISNTYLIVYAHSIEPSRSYMNECKCRWRSWIYSLNTSGRAFRINHISGFSHLQTGYFFTKKL